MNQTQNARQRRVAAKSGKTWSSLISQACATKVNSLAAFVLVVLFAGFVGASAVGLQDVIANSPGDFFAPIHHVQSSHKPVNKVLSAQTQKVEAALTMAELANAQPKVLGATNIVLNAPTGPSSADFGTLTAGDNLLSYTVNSTPNALPSSDSWVVTVDPSISQYFQVSSGGNSPIYHSSFTGSGGTIAFLIAASTIPAGPPPANTSQVTVQVLNSSGSPDANFTVTPVQVRWTIVGSSSGNNAKCISINLLQLDQLSPVANNTLTVGQRFTADLKTQNTGSTTWQNDQGYGFDSQSPLDNTLWGTNKGGANTGSISGGVAPQQIITTPLWLNAPIQPGTYTLAWQMDQRTANGGLFGDICSTTVTVVARASSLSVSPSSFQLTGPANANSFSQSITVINSSSQDVKFYIDQSGYAPSNLIASSDYGISADQAKIIRAYSSNTFSLNFSGVDQSHYTAGNTYSGGLLSFINASQPSDYINVPFSETLSQATNSNVQVTPSTLSYLTWLDNDGVNNFFPNLTVKVNGQATNNFTVTSNVPWAMPAPVSLRLAAGSWVIDKTNLQVGQYSGTFSVVSTDNPPAFTPILVPVTLYATQKTNYTATPNSLSFTGSGNFYPSQKLTIIPGLLPGAFTSNSDIPGLTASFDPSLVSSNDPLIHQLSFNIDTSKLEQGKTYNGNLIIQQNIPAAWIAIVGTNSALAQASTLLTVPVTLTVGAGSSVPTATLTATDTTTKQTVTGTATNPPTLSATVGDVVSYTWAGTGGSSYSLTSNGRNLLNFGGQTYKAAGDAITFPPATSTIGTTYQVVYTATPSAGSPVSVEIDEQVVAASAPTVDSAGTIFNKTAPTTDKTDYIISSDQKSIYGFNASTYVAWGQPTLATNHSVADDSLTRGADVPSYPCGVPGSIYPTNLLPSLAGQSLVANIEGAIANGTGICAATIAGSPSLIPTTFAVLPVSLNLTAANQSQTVPVSQTVTLYNTAGDSFNVSFPDKSITATLSTTTPTTSTYTVTFDPTAFKSLASSGNITYTSTDGKLSTQEFVFYGFRTQQSAVLPDPIGTLVSNPPPVYIVGTGGKLYGFNLPDRASAWGITLPTSFPTPSPADIKSADVPPYPCGGTYPNGLLSTVNKSSSLPNIAANIESVINGANICASSNALPALTTGSSSLSFSSTVGSNPAGQGLNLSVANGVTLTVTPSVTVTTPSGGSWLSVSSTSISVTPNPSGLNIGVTSASLPVGNYTGTIILSGNFQGSPMSIPVSLAVTTAGATSGTVSVPTSPVNVSYTIGSANPSDQTVSLTANPSNLVWRVSSDSAWLIATPLNGLSGQASGSGSINLHINPATLTAGAYTGTVTVSPAAGYSFTPVTVKVVLTVTAANSQTSLQIKGASGYDKTLDSGKDASYTPNTVTANNSNEYLILFGQFAGNNTDQVWYGSSQTQLTSQLLPSFDGNGLQINLPLSGVSLSAGTNIYLKISTTDGLSSSVFGPISVVAAGATALPTLTPGSSRLTFSAVSGSNPAVQGLNLNVPNGVTLTVTPGAVVTTPSGGNWLSVSPSSVSVVSSGSSVNVAVNSASLQVGSYSGSITLSGNFQGSPINVPVTLTVSASLPTSGTVSVPTSPVNVSYTIGSANPSDQTVSLTANPSNLVWRVFSDSAWLTPTPLNGLSGQASGSGSINLHINPATLTAGSYTGTVTVSPAGGYSFTPVTVKVVLTVAAASSGTPQPVISGVQGYPSNVQAWPVNSGVGNIPASDTFLEIYSGSGTFAGSSSSGAPLDTVTINGTPINIASGNGGYDSKSQINVPLSGITASSLSIVVSNSGGQSSASVNVVSAVAPGLTVNPAVLTFNVTAGGNNPSGQTLNLLSSNSSSVNYSASASTQSGGSWLSVSPASGSAPGNVSVSVNAGTLAAGTYTGTVQISGSFTGTPKLIGVILNVAAVNTFSVSTSALSFSVTVGGGNPQTQSFSVTVPSGASFTAAAQSTGNWLSVSGSGSTQTVSVNSSNLTAGSYNGSINVSSGGTTKTINVTLTVAPAVMGTANVSPSSLSFNSTAGSNPSPASLPVSLTSSNGGAFTASAQSTGNWLSVSPTSGTVPGSLSVTVNSVSLSAGNYSGTVAISSQSGQFPTQNVNVSLTVTALPVSVSPTTGSCVPNFSAVQTNYVDPPTITANCSTASFTINNANSQTPWTASVSGPFSISATSGFGQNANITITPVNPGQTVTGSVTVSAGGTSASIPVNLTYNGQPKATGPTLSTTSLSFSGSGSKTVSVSMGTVAWNAGVTSGSSWLSTSVSGANSLGGSYITSGSINVTVNASSLTKVQAYTGTIGVTGLNGAPSQTITVSETP